MWDSIERERERVVTLWHIQLNKLTVLLFLLESNRNELVNQGAIPILVELIHMSDYDIQYYSAAALSNLAVNPKHRAMMIAVGHSDVVRQLVKLLSSKKDRVNRHFMFNY